MQRRKKVETYEDEGLGLGYPPTHQLTRMVEDTCVDGGNLLSLHKQTFHTPTHVPTFLHQQGPRSQRPD